MAAFAVLAVSACGASTPSAGEVATSTTESGSPSSTVGSTTSSSTPVPTTEPNNSDSPSTTQPDDSDSPSTTQPDTTFPDPEDLDPDTAVVLVEGQVLYFAVGTEFANICNVQPSIGFGDVKMHHIGGDFSGSPNLHASLVSEPTFFIVQINPNIGYIAGSGEYIDPYVDHFGVTPPPVTVTPAEGGFIGEVELVNVFTGELVSSRWIIWCDKGVAAGG